MKKATIIMSPHPPVRTRPDEENPPVETVASERQIESNRL